MLPYKKWPLSSKPVYIGHNVWLDEMVCVLPKVTIGDGCIAGALSLVTQSLSPYTMA